MKEMQAVSPRELLEETTALLVARLEARRMSLFLNHTMSNGYFRHKIKQHE